MSSGVNSLAAVTLEDFLKPWLKRLTEGRASQRLYTIVTMLSGQRATLCVTSCVSVTSCGSVASCVRVTPCVLVLHRVC